MQDRIEHRQVEDHRLRGFESHMKLHTQAHHVKVQELAEDHQVEDRLLLE